MRRRMMMDRMTMMMMVIMIKLLPAEENLLAQGTEQLLSSRPWCVVVQLLKKMKINNINIVHLIKDENHECQTMFLPLIPRCYLRISEEQPVVLQTLA